MNRLDIIAEILLREPEPREPSVDPTKSGRIYRVRGGPFDGRLALVDTLSGIEREVERLTSIWDAKALEFVRAQVVEPAEAPKAKTKFVYRVSGGASDGAERVIESLSRQRADTNARAYGRAHGVTLIFLREHVERAKRTRFARPPAESKSPSAVAAAPKRARTSRKARSK